MPPVLVAQHLTGALIELRSADDDVTAYRVLLGKAGGKTTPCIPQVDTKEAIESTARHESADYWDQTAAAARLELVTSGLLIAKRKQYRQTGRDEPSSFHDSMELVQRNDCSNDRQVSPITEIELTESH
ncbi:hypothetical protein FOZ61_000973 [Perkinsus olseni]|uniref:Uncharacterized protein n=1 Tax=Perkinsus olseni TaxID=32597 RepID=A0A7J6KTB3_PEROL|nr:hypothetical protein FOZ61_000973 [Perkinsus olseni]KAF4674368.1 hypothetical protein FOL46_005149 [Perkinsus olseni]